MESAKYARSGIRIFAAAAIVLVAACSGQKKAEQVKLASESASRLQEGVVDYATNQKSWPKHIDELKVGGDDVPGVSYAVGEGGVVAVYFAEGSALPGARLVYTPTQDAQGSVTWSCATQGMTTELKPSGCT